MIFTLQKLKLLSVSSFKANPFEPFSTRALLLALKTYAALTDKKKAELDNVAHKSECCQRGNFAARQNIRRLFIKRVRPRRRNWGIFKFFGAYLRALRERAVPCGRVNNDHVGLRGRARASSQSRKGMANRKVWRIK